MYPLTLSAVYAHESVIADDRYRERMERGVAPLEKVGPGASILRGQVASLFGVPVIMATKMRDDLNVSGLDSGTAVTNDTGYLVVDKARAYLRGEMRGAVVEQDNDVDFSKRKVVVTSRGVMGKYAQSSQGNFKKTEAFITGVLSA